MIDVIDNGPVLHDGNLIRESNAQSLQLYERPGSQSTMPHLKCFECVEG